MERARRLHRPKLLDWQRDGLYKVFRPFVQSLALPQHRYEALLLPGVPHPPSLPLVLDALTLDPHFFAHTLEAKGIPCVIRNVPEAEGWNAPRAWTLEELETNDAIRNRYFKCGEDDDGKRIKVKMKHFLKYLYTNCDDSPLYIFDSGFEDDRKSKKILCKLPIFIHLPCPEPNATCCLLVRIVGCACAHTCILTYPDSSRLQSSSLFPQ